MKRLLVLFLILVVALPGAAFATDVDPIVGQWYFAFDATKAPELASNYAPYEKVIGIYIFQENGVIKVLELDIENGEGTPVYIPQGKWEKNGDNYSCNILGFGEGEAIIEDDFLLINGENMKGLYIKFRKMIPFDPYNDYVYRVNKIN